MKELSIEWTKLLTVEYMNTHPSISQGGLYLWIQNNRITYVGEAVAFRDRMAQHLKCMVDGSYTTWEAKDGENYYTLMKKDGKGLDPKNQAINWATAWDEDKGQWDLETIVNADRIKRTLAVIGKTRFMLGICAELSDDSVMRKEVEGGIIGYLCHKHKLWRGRSTVLGNINKYPLRQYTLLHQGDGKQQAIELLGGDNPLCIGPMAR